MIRAAVILIGAGTPAILAKWLEPSLAVPILVLLAPALIWLWDKYPEDRRRVAPQLEEDELERSRRARKGGA